MSLSIPLPARTLFCPLTVIVLEGNVTVMMDAMVWGDGTLVSTITRDLYTPYRYTNT